MSPAPQPAWHSPSMMRLPDGRIARIRITHEENIMTDPQPPQDEREPDTATEEQQDTANTDVEQLTAPLEPGDDVLILVATEGNSGDVPSGTR